jgi:outer membrane protein
MMKMRFVSTTIYSLSLASLMISCDSSPKVAYVKSQELVYEYQGMKEAQSRFETEKQLFQIQLDSLQQVYRMLISNYQSDAPMLSPVEKKQRQELIQMQEGKLRDEQMQIQEKIKEKEDKLTQGVLNQINSFVELYGKENDYDLIFGTTLSGNILYGNEAIDITKEVKEELNKSYKSESVK